MASFTTVPHYVYSEEIGYTTLKSEYENGATQRRRKRQNAQRRFRLLWRKIGQTTMEEIRDFFVARSGDYEAFDWENPLDETTYEVVFEEGGLAINEAAYQLYDIETSFITA